MRRLLALAVTALLLPALPATASPVSYSFTGEITSTSGEYFTGDTDQPDYAPILADVPVGGPVSFRLTFDADLDPAEQLQFLVFTAPNVSLHLDSGPVLSASPNGFTLNLGLGDEAAIVHYTQTDFYGNLRGYGDDFVFNFNAVTGVGVGRLDGHLGQTFLGDPPFALTFQVSAVPEPAGAGLLACGVVGLGLGMARRRGRKA